MPRDPLATLLGNAAAGQFPPPDGGATILPQPSPRDAGVIGFTAHAVIFIDADPAWVTGLLPPGDLSGPLSPAFLLALCQATNRRPGSTDLLCVSHPLAGPPPIALTPTVVPEHPRVARALKCRDEVRTWRADGGIVLLGCGVAGRWETAVEVDEDRRGQGIGRQLATAARHLVPAGMPLWAQVAPGNAASVRAFLAAGFTPAGAEVLLARSASSG